MSSSACASTYICSVALIIGRCGDRETVAIKNDRFLMLKTEMKMFRRLTRPLAKSRAHLQSKHLFVLTTMQCLNVLVYLFDVEYYQIAMLDDNSTFLNQFETASVNFPSMGNASIDRCHFS
ncbi:Uncharacterised protein r2_g1261 [Pycnogonum litorale]